MPVIPSIGYLYLPPRYICISTGYIGGFGVAAGETETVGGLLLKANKTLKLWKIIGITGAPPNAGAVIIYNATDETEMYRKTIDAYEFAYEGNPIKQWSFTENKEINFQVESQESANYFVVWIISID